MKDHKFISYQEARNIIREVNRMNLKTADFNVIKAKLKPLIYSKLTGIWLGVNNRRFRANKIKDGKPTDAARLTYPPIKCVTDFQRCNSPSNPVFYCASDTVTAIWEIHAEVGDTVFVSSWSVVHPFYCHAIGTHDSDGNVSDIIATFIEGKFLQEIHGSFSYQYKVSAAISEVLADQATVLKNWDALGEGDAYRFGLQSIEYPSATNQNHSNCYALSTAVADNCLKLDYVQEVEVLSIEDEEVRYIEKDISSKILADGTIEWKGVEVVMSKPDEELVLPN